MKKDILQANLLSIIQGKYPNKTSLVKKLMEILQIEKEGVYRRLRGDASFSFVEIAVIAETMGISLDNLIGIDISRARPFSMILVDYESPNEEDFEMCYSYMRLLKVLSGDPTTICTETWNTLPIPMSYRYTAITQFYLLKWTYQFKNYVPARKYNDIKISQEYFELMQENYGHNKTLAKTEYIFDSQIFVNFVNDIKHFYDLRLMQKDNIESLQDELFNFLNYLEQLALTGSFDDTGTKFSLYVSDIHVDLNQCYIESDVYNFCMIRLLAMNAISSVDGTQNEGVRNWLTGHKRLSNLISISGEKERISFFKTQRDAVESLSSVINEN